VLLLRESLTTFTCSALRHPLIAWRVAIACDSCVSPEEIKTASLAHQLEQFYDFMTQERISARLDPPIRAVTAKSYIQLVKLMLGWTHRYRKNPVPLKELSSGGDKRPKSQIPREFDMFGSRAKYQAS